MDGSLEADPAGGLHERLAGVAEREVGAALFRVHPVGHQMPAELLPPCDHGPVEEFLLDVHKRRERVRAARDDPPGYGDRPAANVLLRQAGGLCVVGERCLLELGREHGLAVVDQSVVRVMDGRDFALGIEAGGPRDAAAFVHVGPIGRVKSIGVAVGSRLVADAILVESISELAVLVQPEILMPLRPLADHRDPLALPGRIFPLVEKLVDHVVDRDHRGVDDARDRFRMAGQLHHAL